jgi:SH3-like domain-containing protein
MRSGLVGLFGLASTAIAGAFFSIPDRAAAESWRITNLDASGRVHIRQRASSRSRIIGYIPGDARGVSGGPCRANWCPIEFRGVKGWVYRRYLTADDQAARTGRRKAAATRAASPDMAVLAESKTLKLAASNGRPIPVFAFPNDQLPVAGHIAANTETVEGLGACIRTYCYVRSGRLIGWLPSTMIAGADDEAEIEAKPEAVTAALPEPVPADEDKALNETETTATSLVVETDNAAIASEPGEGETKFYTLAGVPGESSLAMYERPDAKAAIVAWMPNAATKVEGLRKCVEQWCLVRWQDKNGWVARRHLADKSIEGSQTFQVTGLTIWKPLDVRDQPSENANIIGSIPSYATGIVPIGGCDKSWCHIRYLGIAGWVSGQNLAPQKR